MFYRSDKTTTSPQRTQSKQNNIVIYEDDVEIAGGYYRQEKVTSFLSLKNKHIMLEPEPYNEHDDYAIKVIGTGKKWGKHYKYHIGYIPRFKARALYEINEFHKIHAAYHPLNDQNYHVGDSFDPDIKLMIKLYGPKNELKTYLQNR